jgi:hypothetical protein
LLWQWPTRTEKAVILLDGNRLRSAAQSGSCCYRSPKAATAATTAGTAASGRHENAGAFGYVTENTREQPHEASTKCPPAPAQPRREPGPTHDVVTEPRPGAAPNASFPHGSAAARPSVLPADGRAGASANPQPEAARKLTSCLRRSAAALFASHSTWNCNSLHAGSRVPRASRATTDASGGGGLVLAVSTFRRRAGLGRLRKTPPNPVIRRPRFGGEGSALCGCKPRQILRRLLAPQNDIIRGLFPQPVEPEFTPRGRATRAIASTRAGLKPRSAPHGEVNSPLRQQAGAPE